MDISKCRLCNEGVANIEYGEYGYSVRCSNCNVFSHHYREKHKAVEAWNREMEPKEKDSIKNTLKERGNRYGEFKTHGFISQSLKSVMTCQDGWSRLEAHQKEALEMIAHKIARILNGDHDYVDNWHDIAGYATLVEKELKAVSDE